MPSRVIQLRVILLTILLSLGICFGSDLDIREKIMLGKANSAAGANSIVAALQECAGFIANNPKNPSTRRPYELMMREAQDAAVRHVSPEAQKVYAAVLPRLSAESIVSLCYAMKAVPASPDVDAAATKMLVPGIDFRVRTGLIELLGAHHYGPAVDKIAVGLDPVAPASIQIAACRALATIPDKKSVPALIKYMLALSPGKGGRFLYEATGALRTLTGQTIVANALEWKKWWEPHQKEFGFDGTKVLEPDYNYELSEKQEIEYYEVPVVENRLVIVLDTSGSMEMGGRPNRIESAKIAMKAFVKSLPEKTLFNIVAFSQNVRRWRKDVPLLAATEANKKEAVRFIDSQTANGGTQTTLAMEEVLRDIAVVNGCETVYLVTDGNPNPIGNINADQQEQLITWINQSLKIRINTIGIYSTVPADEKFMAAHGFKEDLDKMKKFLYDLSSNNDGVYREVGKDGTNTVVKVEPKKEKMMKDKDDKDKMDKVAKEKLEKEKLEKEAADRVAKEKAGTKPDPVDKSKPVQPEKSETEIDITGLLKKPDAKKAEDSKPEDRKPDDKKAAPTQADEAIISERKKDDSKTDVPNAPKKPNPFE